MGAFLNRSIMPVDASYPAMPTGLLSIAQSGKTQFRAVQHVGRQWTETYGPIDSESLTGRAFIAELNDIYRKGTIINVLHPKVRALLGAGGGTPLVQGGSQTGISIVTDGWPNSTVVLRGGDFVHFDGVPTIYDVVFDVTSNGSGAAAIVINPPIFAGGSPADNAAIFSGLTISWKVRVVAVEPAVASAGIAGYSTGLRITLREAL